MSNDTGTYVQSFTIPIGGLEIAPACDIPLGEHGIKSTLSITEEQLTLTLEILNVDEVSAPPLAGRIASLLRDALVLEFAEHVEHVGDMKPSAFRFNPTSQPGSPRIQIRTAEELRIGTGEESSSYRLAISQLKDISHSIAMKLDVPEIPTSTDLYIAKELFRTGMQSHDKVARFLVLYSAVELMAIFKGMKTDRMQESVDNLLKSVNPSLPSFKPSGSKKHRDESLYTMLRNEFVHAAERHKNPSAARAAIESNIRAFQRDVANLLKGC